MENVQKLLAASPEQASRAFRGLQAEVKKRAANGTQRVESDTMPDDAPKTDTRFFKSVADAIKESGREAGASAAKLRLWITTSALGIVWLITLALAGMIWKDTTGKIEKLEVQAQQLVLDNATMKAEKAEVSRRLENVEKDLKEVLNELRKPK